MLKMTKICFLGSHGTGKSTASYHLTSLLKQHNPAKSIICLEENVRNIAQLTKLNDLMFPKLAITNQLFRELQSELLYDTIITDRSTLDYLAYSKVNELKLDDNYKNLAITHMESFNKIYFIRPEDKNSRIANDGFRDTNKSFRNKIDEMFEILLGLNQIKYTELKTSQIFTYNYLKDLNV